MWRRGWDSFRTRHAHINNLAQFLPDRNGRIAQNLATRNGIGTPQPKTVPTVKRRELLEGKLLLFPTGEGISLLKQVDVPTPRALRTSWKYSALVGSGKDLVRIFGTRSSFRGDAW